MDNSRAKPAVASWGFLGAIFLVTIAYFHLSEQTQSVLYDLVAIAAALAMGLGVLRSRPDETFAWILLCLGVGLWAAGDVVFGTSQPVPSLADVFYISAYPLLGLGVAGLVRIRVAGWNDSILTDSLVLATAVAIVAGVFLLVPAGHARGAGVAGRVVSLGYPVMDLALLAGVIHAWRRGSWGRGVVILLGLAVAARCLADTGYALQDFGATYVVGSPIDAAFLASYGLAGAALLHPSLAPVPAPPLVASSSPIAVVGTPTLTLVPVAPPAIALRLRVVLGWAGVMLLGLSALALFLSVAWGAMGVVGLAGAYGMTGTLMLVGAAVRS